MVTFADITRRVRAEEAMRLRDRASKAIAQGILISDPAQPENPIIYANDAFERLTGYAVRGQGAELPFPPGAGDRPGDDRGTRRGDPRAA